MKILLVQSWLGRKQHPVFPLGLTCIASALEGHSVKLADPNIHSYPMEYLRGVLSEYRPHVVGLSLRNCDTTAYHDRFSYLPAFFQQVRLIRSQLPGAYIIAGGAGFSIFSSEIMDQCPALDCGVTGHGEIIVRELMEKRAGGVHRGFEGFFLEPRLDLVDSSAYSPFQRNLAVGVEVNRGCREKCSYCSYSSISGRRVLERDTGIILKEVGYHVDNGASHVFLVAPVLNSTRRRGVELARAIASSGLPVTWEAYHSAKGFDEPYAALAAGAGCTAVSFSPDGGTVEQMKLTGKGYTPEDLEKAVKSASSAGINVSINVFPWHEETGISGMFQAFSIGRCWGTLAGEQLRRLRFSLVRRMPNTPFAPASVFLDRKEFERPSGWGIPAFLVLKALLEVDRKI